MNVINIDIGAYTRFFRGAIIVNFELRSNWSNGLHLSFIKVNLSINNVIESLLKVQFVAINLSILRDFVFEAIRWKLGLEM